MSSILKVDTIQDQSGNNIINESNNVITIGASGDTITVPAGATVSGFTSAGIDDNATSTAITISSAEDVTFTEDILLGDGKKAIFGASSDLKIYHDGSSIISEEGGGNLQFRTNGPTINFQKENSEDMAVFTADGSVSLYYDNAKKFETTATGATVTGVASASGAFLSTVNNSLLTFGGGNAGNVGSNLTMYGGANGSTGDFRFRNATTINAFITAAGQIQGIGGAVSAPTFSFTADTDTGISRPTTNALNFVTAGAERARIDASGNVYIGKTSGVLANVGHEFNAGSYASHTRDGDVTLYLNRKSSNGTIQEFRKDNTAFGSIGVVNNDNPFFQGNATNHGGLQCGTNTILPCKNSANSDNTINLGQSDIRWKDIYLSGGAFLGGTGTANKLEDYEEGTWTPNIGGNASYSAQAGHYRKIGNMVFANFQIQINVKGTGNGSKLAGLPFNSSSNSAVNVQSGYTSYFANLAINVNSLAFYVERGAGTAEFVATTSTTATTANGAAVFGNGAHIYGAVVYATDA